MSKATDHDRLHILAERHGWRCDYCDIAIRCVFCDPYGTAQPASRDHLIPRSLGGGNPYSQKVNSVAACYGCNQRKGIMSESEYRALIARERANPKGRDEEDSHAVRP